jgi:uncharacterized protein (DUF2384 family)
LNRPFAKRFNAPRLSKEEADRQGRISRRAIEVLGKTDAVIKFLNGHDEALGGRPIDLAIAGEDGLLAVEQALTARAAEAA